MTNRELIEKRIPYPISEMVMRNATLGMTRNWLDQETSKTYAHELLSGAFVFYDTPEGGDFWWKFRNKLEAKNL